MPVRAASLLLLAAFVPAVLAAPIAGGQQAQQATAATQPALEGSFLETLLSGPATRPGEVVGRYGEATVTRQQLMEFLLQTRGLDALLNLMQFQIARSLAAEQGITITPADVKAEERNTLRQAFASVQDITEQQYDDLVTQLLAQQQLSRAEFDVVIATNAYLKAIARPQIEALLTEENLRKAFNARYGEQVRVRHVQLENLAQVAEVRKRIDAGEDFGKVASEVSRNLETRQVGGMFPPFSMQSDVPESFKLAAFQLEVGQVSDPVEAGGFYHLIKLEERIEPRAVQFENVRESLKKTVAEEQLLLLTARLRRALAQQLASDELQVLDPVLAGQLRLRLEQLRPQPVPEIDPATQPQAPPE